MRKILKKARPARAAKYALAATALVMLAALGTWYLTRSPAEKPRLTLSQLPQGTTLAVTEIQGYVPNLSTEEVAILESGPVADNMASMKLYLLAKAKLEADPMTRTRLLQEAVALTEGYGTLPPITADNPQVRSVIDALVNKKNPERLNPLVAPAPFDETAYKSNPDAYLSIAEPGRVFQMKAPGGSVVKIEPISPYFQDVQQGDSVELSVRAIPGAPVTFTTFDAGSLENGLTTMTVSADSAGIAKVKFVATKGVVLETNILAASPLTSGQVRFKVNTLVQRN